MDRLVVTSKIKAVIKKNANLNTSSGAIEELSERVHDLVTRAIASARADGRQTVMDRDIPTLPSVK